MSFFVAFVLEKSLLRKENIETTTQAALGSNPFHPGLAAIPAILLLGAFLSDLAYLGTGHALWPGQSMWLIGGALSIGALLALFRLTDFLTIRRVQARDRGLWLALLSTISLGLTFFSLWLRFDNAEASLLRAFLLLSLAIVGLLLANDALAGQSKLHRTWIGATDDHPN